MAMVVVLPAPLPPSRPTVAPTGTVKAIIVDREGLAIALGQVVHADGVHGGGIVRPGPSGNWRFAHGCLGCAPMIDFTPAPASLPPGQRVYAVGDVHGCLDRLRALHDLIADDLAARPVAETVLVHLGDYVDRGPDSAGVVALLAEGDLLANVPTVNLMGNHEHMMLAALATGRGRCDRSVAAQRRGRLAAELGRAALGATEGVGVVSAQAASGVPARSGGAP